MKRYHDCLPRYVKVPLPDGTVRVLTETSYTALVTGMGMLREALEKAEYIDSPQEMRMAHLAGGPFWKRLLADAPTAGNRRISVIHAARTGKGK